MTHQTNFKPSRTARKLAKLKDRQELVNAEEREKRKVRKRDGRCRFPLCGCRKLRLNLEVSHDEHKGWNGPATKRAVSTDVGMIYLCNHRHQFGRISRHMGTLRIRHLTEARNNGPVAWDIDLREIPMSGAGSNLREPLWFEVARESAVQQLEPLTDQQRGILAMLAEMEL